MSSDISRRDFVKVAGAGAAAFTIAAAPFSYAQNNKVVVGCIGLGGQGCFHLNEGLCKNNDIHVAAFSDVYAANQKSAMPLVMLSNAKQYLAEGAPVTEEMKAAAKALPKPNVYYNYKEMLEKETLDGVVIASPLMTHAPVTLDALDAGKYVFCEKTMVRTVEEGRAVVQKCHDTGKFVQVGHQRRYNPKYNLGMWMTYDRGMLGRITHITAQWHRNNQWRRPVPKDYVLNEEEKKYIPDFELHMNWRLFDEVSGGLYTELATHQTDIANWYLKSLPSRVFSVAGLDYWKDGRTAHDNIVLVFEYDLKRSSPGFIQTKSRTTLMDDSTANRNYTVRFVYTSILSNAKRGASELIQGDLGTLELTENVCKYYQEDVTYATQENLTAEELAKKTASGTSLRLSNKELTEGKELFGDQTDLKIPDAYQFEAFIEGVRTGKVPRNNQMVGFTTALTAIAAIQSRKEGKMIDFDPAWTTFDFETPSFYEYDPSWGENMPKPAAAPAPAAEVTTAPAPDAAAAPAPAAAPEAPAAPAAPAQS